LSGEIGGAHLKAADGHSDTYRVTMTILPESPPTPSRTTPSRRTAAVVAALLATAVAVGGWLWLRNDSSPAPAAASRPSSIAPLPATPRQWLTAVLAAADGKGSVHMQVVNRLKGRTLRYSDDDGPDRGTQRISVTPGMRAEVRVIGRQTYFTANRKAFQDYFGFPARVAGIIGGHWLLLEPGMPMYKRVTEGVTFRSAMEEMALKGPLRLVPARSIDGVRVVGIRGLADGPALPSGTRMTATLWVTATAHPVPVRYDARAKSLGRMVATFSDWGATIDVVPPAEAIPFTRLLAPGNTTA
jgi:hypothetical protein